MTPLPGLPPSQMNVEVWDSEVRGLHQANAPYFTAAQMLELQRQTLEWAASVCDRLAHTIDNGGERCKQPATAPECAAAIREAIK